MGSTKPPPWGRRKRRIRSGSVLGRRWRRDLARSRQHHGGAPVKLAHRGPPATGAVSKSSGAIDLDAALGTHARFLTSFHTFPCHRLPPCWQAASPPVTQNTKQRACPSRQAAGPDWLADRSPCELDSGVGSVPRGLLVQSLNLSESFTREERPPAREITGAHRRSRGGRSLRRLGWPRRPPRPACRRRGRSSPRSSTAR